MAFHLRIDQIYIVFRKCYKNKQDRGAFYFLYNGQSFRDAPADAYRNAENTYESCPTTQCTAKTNAPSNTPVAQPRYTQLHHSQKTQKKLPRTALRGIQRYRYAYGRRSSQQNRHSIAIRQLFFSGIGKPRTRRSSAASAYARRSFISLALRTCVNTNIFCIALAPRARSMARTCRRCTRGNNRRQCGKGTNTIRSAVFSGLRALAAPASSNV